MEESVDKWQIQKQSNKFLPNVLAENAHSLEGTSIIVSGRLEEAAFEVNSNKVAYIKE